MELSQFHKFLNMLSRYYYYELGYGKQQIIYELNTFMENHYPRYNPLDWSQYIETYAGRAEKYPLCQCPGIWITENEIKVIEKLCSKVLERLAFTLLCLAKFRNFRNHDNNSWVNQEDSEIYKLACITTTAFDKGIRLHQLRELKLIEYANKVDNLSIQVLFIDDDSVNKLFVSDFRKLGYLWRAYKGEPYIKCADCKILTRKTSNSKKYCTSCSKIHTSNNKNRWDLDNRIRKPEK